MSRILAFTEGPQDWQAQLADPEKHWKSGYSARTLAYAWEGAQGFPVEVAVVLGRSAEPLLGSMEPLLAVPEFKVPLPGGRRASQNDIFVLARSTAGPVTIMVEGKVNESFGPFLGEWRADASSGKTKRLSFLLRTLGLNRFVPDSIRYQLFHRAASAVIVGEQYRAAAAMLLIHSFSQERVGFADYRVFAELFGVEAEEGIVQRLTSASTIPLFGAWIVGDPKFLHC